MLSLFVGLIPAPWRVWIALAAVGALVIAAFAAGKTWEGNARDALELERSEAARREEGRLAGIAYEIGLALAQKHAQAEGDRLAWEQDKRKAVKNGALVKVNCGAGLQDSAPGATAVRLAADFVRLFDAGTCIGAPDCAGGVDAGAKTANAPR